MGCYASVSFQPVIETTDMVSTVDVEIKGCEKCKTQTETKFCSHCGQKVKIYKQKRKIHLDNWYSIWERYYDNDGSVYGEDDFYTPCYIGNILLDNCSRDSVTIEENTYKEFPSIEEQENSLKKFKDKHKDLLEKLEKDGFKPRVIYACVFNYS